MLDAPSIFRIGFNNNNESISSSGLYSGGTVTDKNQSKSCDLGNPTMRSPDDRQSGVFFRPDRDNHGTLRSETTALGFTMSLKKQARGVAATIHEVVIGRREKIWFTWRARSIPAATQREIYIYLNKGNYKTAILENKRFYLFSWTSNKCSWALHTCTRELRF